ncbi:hypothetical protein [Pseudothioclava arenosa]|uniref:Uncharacterized protein n=1 Tax=Pseudothioclava arenosa TaxID=1795308 RepID=A0A2A4CKF1_9RHOB|nr:hypothetical protein [Pseudothioclava arenosa]PCD75751.1 hypothetical protein CLN94_12670 [Pseudothioclava arenosa]
MLILHIGSPKTGTTSLQGFLTGNDAALRARGINYVRAARPHIAHNPVAFAIPNDAHHEMLAEIEKEVLAAPEMTHVVSSELFFRPMLARVIARDFPPALRPLTRTVCYIRRQDIYLESLYKQRAKNGLVSGSRQEFLQKNIPKLRYSDCLAPFLELNPDATPLLRIFDRALLKGGDVIDDFASLALGLDDITGFERAQGDANLSYSVEMSEMIGHAAQVQGVNSKALLRELRKVERDPLLISSRDTFTLEERRGLMETLAEDNETLRSIYFPDSRAVFDMTDLEQDQELPQMAPEMIEMRSAAAKEAMKTAMDNLHPKAPETAEADDLADEESGATTGAGDYPIWYQEIFPAGGQQGFYHWLGRHGLTYVERDPRKLMVTFDNLHNVGNKELARNPWAASFCRDRGYSHLGVLAQHPDWYRDPKLIQFFAGLAKNGFFKRFDKVVFAGTSMGAFGALSFCEHAPGATVLAFSPQSSLHKGLVPWEPRFAKGTAADWTLPGSDAAETARSAGKVYLVYDHFHELDRRHAKRFEGANIVRLKAFGMGHKSALVAHRMGLLKTLMTEAMEGEIAPLAFYRGIRARKDIFLYREAVAEALVAAGKPERAQTFKDAFKRRRRKIARQEMIRARRAETRRKAAEAQ